MSRSSIPYEFDAERFSRWMSYVLRHNPTRYGLQPDRHGYVSLEEFMAIAKRRYPTMTPEQLEALINGVGASRFEIMAHRLRARYGHSIPVEPAGPSVTPPARLYHGTDVAHSETIRLNGLKPLERQMLHLSATREDALAIARRKSEQPVIVEVMAQEASETGIMFYHEGHVYLTNTIPVQFVSIEL